MRFNFVISIKKVEHKYMNNSLFRDKLLVEREISSRGKINQKWNRKTHSFEYHKRNVYLSIGNRILILK